MTRTARERGEQLGRARGHRLAASDGIGDDELAVARVGDVGAALAADEQATEVVPGAVHVVACSRGSRRDRRRATSQSAKAAEPSDRNWRHGGSCGGMPTIATTARSIAVTSDAWRRSPSSHAPLAAHRGVPSAGGAVLDEARRAGRRRRAHTTRCPSTGCRASSSWIRRRGRPRR